MTNERQQEIFALERVFIQVKRRMDCEWNKENIGLTAIQGRILIRLFEDGPQKASVLAEKLYITAGAVTGIADKLLDMGLIERERDMDDRRVVYLVLVEQGRELVEKLRAKRAAIMDMMFAGLSTEDVSELTRIFNQIITNMDEANVEEKK
ncbi:MarR family transcriptional regulator [Paenibacillus oenotherae]|uniref:MarR family transcriptional regulator n=1 Tax=Paenibacillus oenotherae TaxID=1435645 RepID=A0ABS7D1L4_9BACL|nr:MarR family transcriptional regulator [Paenibacillus oenotherae]MBW7473819.1 MarR family transcriptional regulator [Paenibacillus oenotherae]